MHPGRARLRRAAANAALVLGSTVFALGLLEIGVRIFRPQPLSAIHRSARLGTGFMLRSKVVSDSNMASIGV